MSEINTEAVYKKLKKQNGEAAAKVIREAVLLDVPGIAHILEFAGNNADEIKRLVPVIREVYKKDEKSEYHTNKNPLELLSEAGYDAFVVQTEEQKNSIAKYYRPKERLCTFHDPHRHEIYHMIHAVKRGADKIKPSAKPRREDEYGTSVISIQMAKNGGFISIKNRYNHTVKDPDATFNNNPDNIIPGLKDSLQKYFKIAFHTTEHPLPSNFQVVNDQLVRYNYEIDNVYIGPSYYFYGNEIHKLNKDYEIMLDYLILDVRTGKVRTPYNYEERKTVTKLLDKIFRIDFDNDWLAEGWVGLGDDGARKVFNEIFGNNITTNKKIAIQVNPENKDEKIVFVNEQKVATVENGKITNLVLPNSKIGDNFLFYNDALKTLQAPKVREIGSNFLYKNNALKELHLPSVQTIGKNCLDYNTSLSVLEVPKGRVRKLSLLVAKNKLKRKMKDKKRKLIEHIEERNGILNLLKRGLDSMRVKG